MRDQLDIIRQLPIDRPVVQYIRQSTRKQVKRNRISGEMQDADMKNTLIETHGYKPELILPAISKDTGKSGTKSRLQRSGLDELYRLIETDSVGAAAAFSVSRIYRSLSLAETGRFCDLLLEHRIPFITKRRIYWPIRDDIKALQADFQASADYITEHILGTMIAGRDYHVAENGSYGGNGVPVGFQVIEIALEDEDGEELIVKRYVEYTPHANLVRWLFKRYHELSGNLPLLGRELEHIDFRFPRLESGIITNLKLRKDADGTYPLRNRDALVDILSNRAYIGAYEFGETTINNAHDALVSLDDFAFANPTDKSKRETRPRRYSDGASTALLDGIVRSGNDPVYVVQDQYVAQPYNNRWRTQVLVVDVSHIDAAFASRFETMLLKLERSDYAAELHRQIQEIKQQQQRTAVDYTKNLIRIDTEIKNAEMAQRVSQRLGDEHGYTAATTQLVQLRQDKTAYEAEQHQANSKASDLEECHELIDKACCEWNSWKPDKRKRLIRMLLPAADMTAVSPHFIRLRCYFMTPLYRTLDMYLYRHNGSRHVWSTAELKTLRELFPVASKQQLMAALPAVTWQAINQRAQVLGMLPSGSYSRDLPLTYSDMRVMEATGARTDKVTWMLAPEDEGISQYEGGVG